MPAVGTVCGVWCVAHNCLQLAIVGSRGFVSGHGDFSQLGLPDIDATNITTSQAAKKFTFCECFVSGHDFSRAVIHLKLSRALAPVVGFRGRTTTFSAASSAVRTGPLNSCRSQRLRPARVRLFKRRFERARLQPCRTRPYFCHHEATSVAEGSAFLAFQQPPYRNSIPVLELLSSFLTSAIIFCVTPSPFSRYL